MTTMRIRTFTVLCLVLLLFLPWTFFVAAHYAVTQSFSFETSHSQKERLQAHLNETIRLIESDPAWSDPAWQQQLRDRLRQAKADMDMRTAADSNAVQVAAAFAGVLLAFAIAAFGMRRFLLTPLERMSLAARQIAGGDWEVRIPASRIAEIAEVREGFDVMVKGLRQSYRKQAELEEERRFVIAAVAHDLRTPLFALRGYLDGLIQGIAQTPEKAAQYLAVCKEKSEQLDRLVEDLFTFTKMDYMENKLEREKIDFGLMMRKSIDSLSPSARRKNITISNDVLDGCFAGGDAHLLERAISNLLDNAVRHTPVHGEIIVRCYKEGGQVKFSVRDTGPGFLPEELQRVFEPLYRGEASRNRSTGGSGLGLTIARKIVRRHGGELKAGNHPEGGALLTGWLPEAGPEQC